MTQPIHLQNEHLQVGVLPQTGASLAYLRVWNKGNWQDVLRPTPSDQYDNPSATSSFLMLPWVNRIRDGKFTFEGVEYQLEVTKDDGTARHGDVRKRPWEVMSSDEMRCLLTVDSRDFDDVNFPFVFSAQEEVTLKENQLIVTVTLTNEDSRPMPCGFGHHPYFVSLPDDPPSVQIPCSHYWVLDERLMPTGEIFPVDNHLDFRNGREVNGEYNDILTQLTHDNIVIVYLNTGTRVQMNMEYAKHYLLFTPKGEDSVAIEPMTLVTDGFNLPLPSDTTGLWVLQSGESKSSQLVIDVGSA